MLAGMPQAPSAVLAGATTRRARSARRNEVLGKMAELGYITRASGARAEMKPRASA